MFRVISLWLANQDFEFQDGDETFEELLNMIPSWKFVTVLPQLAPRLTNEDTAFIKILKNIISNYLCNCFCRIKLIFAALLCPRGNFKNVSSQISV